MKEYKKILEDLYNGKIKPSQDEIKSEEYARIRKESIELSNKILSSLNIKTKRYIINIWNYKRNYKVLIQKFNL